MKYCIELLAFVSATILIFGCGPMDEIDSQSDDSTRVVNHDRSTEDTFLPGSCKNPSGGNYCGKKSPDNCWCDNLCIQYNDCCEDIKPVCDGSPTPTPTPNPTPTPTPGPTPTPTPGPTPTPTPGPTPTPTPGPTPTPTPGPTPTPAKSCKNPSGGDYCGKKSPDGCWCDNLCSQYNDCCPDKQQVCDGNPTPTPTPTPGPTPTPTPGPTPTPTPQPTPTPEPTPDPNVTELVDGQRIKITGNGGVPLYLTFQCNDKAVFQTGSTKSDGWVYMYVRNGEKPTTTVYDCKSEDNTPEQRCEINGAGKIWIMMYYPDKGWTVPIRATCGPQPTPHPKAVDCLNCHKAIHYPERDCFTCHPDGCPS